MNVKAEQLFDLSCVCLSVLSSSSSRILVLRVPGKEFGASTVFEGLGFSAETIYLVLAMYGNLTPTYCCISDFGFRASTHRLQSSSFLGLPYRILNMNPQKEQLWSL